MILLLILLACYNLNSIARAEDVNDYVNGLPSEERYVYMKNVARRIVQEVKVNGTPNATSFEIPDTMLVKSNEHVNKVMQEELTKIKTARKNIKKRPQNVTRPEDREAKYVNFTFRTDLHDDLRDHIDLTIAEGRKSIDPVAAASAVQVNPKSVIKREVSEVPVEVVFDQPTGSKRNERRSWDREDDDDDDYDRKDDNAKTVEEKSNEEKSKEVNNLDDKPSKTNKDDDDARSLQSTESKQAEVDKKGPPDSQEENKTFTPFSPSVTNEKDNDTATEAPLPETRRPGIDDTTLLVDHKDDATFPTTEVFLDTESTQTLFPPIEPDLITASQTEKPVLRILDQETDSKISSEEHQSSTLQTETTIPTTHEVETTVSNTKESTSTISTTQEPESTESTTQAAPSIVFITQKLESTTTTQKPESTTTTQKPETTEYTTQEPKNPVTTTEEPESTVSTTPEPETTVSTTQEPKIVVILNQQPDGTVPAVQGSQKAQEKKSLRNGVISEEADGRNVVYRADKLLLRDGTQATDGPLHFETLLKAEPKPTKKVRFQEVAEENVVPSKNHEHGILYYRVYEVDPDVNPFKLRSDGTENRNQPYYAPVYNYEPESVYFSPQSRQGSILKAGNDEEQSSFRQGDSKELRTNIEQEPYVPVYNYEPANAYYDPQNRLGPNVDNADEDLYYKRAGVKTATSTGKGKIDEDYYNARNEAIEDSLESRKFRFRGLPGVGDPGKPPFLKPPPLTQKGLLINQFIYASTHQPKNQNRHQINFDYTDYYYGRKDGLRHEDQKANTQNLDELYVHLGQYFAKKKKASLTNMRKVKKDTVHSLSKDETKRKDHNPADEKPVSLDYYFGVHNPGAILYKLKLNQNPVVSTQKPTRVGYRHRARETNAIDLDYYFDRKDSNDGRVDEDFPDYTDKQNLDAGKVVSRKSHKHKASRTENDKHKDFLKPYTRVLKDMFEIKSGILVKYDWLGTTVNIRTAVAKLLDIFDAEDHGERVDPKDKEVLKYLIAVHREAANTTQTDTKEASGACVAAKLPLLVVEALRYKYKRKQLLPKNKHRKPGERIKNPLKLMKEVYTRLMRSCTDSEETKAAQEFRTFLLDLEDGLRDFHTAIKRIASVTKYDKQDWYQNIKDLYLSRTKSKSKELLEVLTHLVVMEVFERVEQSAKEGLEDNSVKYKELHPEEFEQTRNEMSFVLRLLREIKSYDK